MIERKLQLKNDLLIKSKKSRRLTPNEVGTTRLVFHKSKTLLIHE